MYYFQQDQGRLRLENPRQAELGTWITWASEVTSCNWITSKVCKCDDGGLEEHTMLNSSARLKEVACQTTAQAVML